VEDLDPFASRGSGSPSAKFPNQGDKVEGKITNVQYRQDTDQKTRKVKTFDDGAPRPVVVLTLVQADGEEIRDFVKGRSVSRLRERVWAVEGEGEGPKLGADYSRTFTHLKDGIGPEKEYDITYSNSGTDDRDLV
jgi:hypothetical protein